jgi:type IV pilus assembly protein PilO
MDFKNPRAQKLVLAGIAMVGVGYLYFFATFVPFGYRAMAAEKKQLQTQYEQLSSDLNKARQTLSSMGKVTAEFEAIQRRWTAAQTLLPEEREVANLLRMVSLVGQQAGVSFDLFRPMPTLPQGYYIENPVDIKVTGGYHEVGEFLADVANLSRIVKVSNLSIQGFDQGMTDETVQASFTASAYTLNPNPEPVEVEADKKGSATKDAKKEDRAGKSHSKKTKVKEAVDEKG